MAILDDEVKDPLEEMDEEDEEEEGEDIDPKKLKAKGLHIEEDIHDPEVPVDPFLEKDLILKDPLLPDTDLEDDEEEPELEDEEFADGPEW